MQTYAEATCPRPPKKEQKKPTKKKPDTCLNPNLHGPTRNYISSLVFEDSQAQ